MVVVSVGGGGCWLAVVIVYLVPGLRPTGREQRAGGEGEKGRLRWRCSRVLYAFPEKSRRWNGRSVSVRVSVSMSRSVK